MKMCSNCLGCQTADRYGPNGHVCLDCKAARRRKSRTSNRKHHNKVLKHWQSQNKHKMMFYSAKKRAKALGRAFTITQDDVVIPKHCPALGIKLRLDANKRADDSPTLDRIDSTQGYVKGNVVVISWRANRIKNDSTLEELEAITAFVKSL